MSEKVTHERTRWVAEGYSNTDLSAEITWCGAFTKDVALCGTSVPTCKKCLANIAKKKIPTGTATVE